MSVVTKETIQHTFINIDTVFPSYVYFISRIAYAFVGSTEIFTNSIWADIRI